MKEERLLKNEKGSVLVVALVMLLLLTLIGISATETSRIDLQIAGNEMVYKENFYQAEAGVMRAIQAMENSDLVAAPPSWVAIAEDSIGDDDIRDAANWGIGGFPNGTVAGDAAPLLNTKMVAVFDGISGGLTVDEPRIREYRVFGRSTTKNGQVIILAGYRKPQ